MEELNQETLSNRQVISRKAWVAYVIPLTISSCCLAVVILMYLQSFYREGSQPYFALIVPLILSAIWILKIRSYKLYTDDDGVWIFSGIFPWNKGSRGVKWRDLDKAVYFTGFISWALKAYTIKISHRFTKANEIVLINMNAGNNAVILINNYHRDFIASEKEDVV